MTVFLVRAWWQTLLHRQLPPPHRTPAGSSLYRWRIQEIMPQPILTSSLSERSDLKSVLFSTVLFHSIAPHCTLVPLEFCSPGLYSWTPWLQLSRNRMSASVDVGWQSGILTVSCALLGSFFYRSLTVFLFYDKAEEVQSVYLLHIFTWHYR